MQDGRTGVRIVLVTTHLGRGGAEKQLSLLARGLANRGWVVRVISLMPASAHVDFLSAYGIPVQSFALRASPLSLLRTSTQLKRALTDFAPQVLISFNYHANILARVAGRAARIPRIVSSIRSPNFGGWHRDVLERMTSPLAHVTTTNSARTSTELVARGVLSRKNAMHVVPNMVSRDEVISRKSEILNRLGLPVGTFIWGAVGRLERPKGYPCLIEAFAMLSDTGSALVIAGEGSMESELRSLVKAKASTNVHFIGLERDVPGFLGSCDAYVLSSLWEGMPNALMEAMQFGVPVVATRVGGVPELIEEGINGFMVDPGDSDQLGVAMRRVQSMSHRERLKLGAAARKGIIRDHDEAAIVDLWISLALGRCE